MPPSLELSTGHRTGKGQFSFRSQRKAVPKSVQTTAQLHSFHMLTRYCSKSFKLGLGVHELRISRCTAGYRKGRRTRDQIANIHWIIEGFSCVSIGKEFACNVGDPGSIPQLGRSPGEGKGTHSSILAWRTPWSVYSMRSKIVGHDWTTKHTHWIIEKAREFQKNIYLSFIDYAKALDCVDHTKPENS